MTTQLKTMIGGVVALALVLVALVVVLATTGGDDGKDASSPASSTPSSAAPSDTPTTGGDDTAPAGLEKFYGQRLDWQPCDQGQDCAMLTVPIDYADPTGKTIGLKLERQPATDQADKVGSLVVNPGGPGAPGTAMATDADFYFRPQLLAREDIVAFDPRGTGGSDPITCLSDADLDAYVAQDPAPDTAADARKYVAEEDSFFKGCVADSDSLIGHISTVEAAKDMDVLRSALGEKTLSYLGFSYGTKLGATYASLFPDKVGRFVLDGAEDPDLDFKQAALTQAGGFETALRAYVQDCLDKGSCFLGTSMNAALAKISGLLDQIDEQPLPTSSSVLGGRTLSIGNAFYGIVTPLYSKDNWQYLDQGLQQAFDGEGDTLLLLSDSYASRDSTTGKYTDNSLQAFLAISCLDDPSTLQPSQVRAEYPAFEKASPTFGDVFAWGLVGCHGIQVKAEDPPPVIAAKGAAPILVLGTTRDPATPFKEAVALAHELDSGVLISRDGDGHTAYNKGNDCIDEAVEGYLLDGTVPQDGLKC